MEAYYSEFYEAYTAIEKEYRACIFSVISPYVNSSKQSNYHLRNYDFILSIINQYINLIYKLIKQYKYDYSLIKRQIEMIIDYRALLMQHLRENNEAKNNKYEITNDGLYENILRLEQKLYSNMTNLASFAFNKKNLTLDFCDEMYYLTEMLSKVQCIKFDIDIMKLNSGKIHKDEFDRQIDEYKTKSKLSDYLNKVGWVCGRNGLRTRMQSSEFNIDDKNDDNNSPEL